METITSFLTDDHRYADDLFAAAVKDAAQGAWDDCAQHLAQFRVALETHMKVEEHALFPAFEQATGTDAGPTAVMRSEHVQMLSALGEIGAARDARDAQRFESLAQSFTDILDMHSMKEETILYPMCDRMVQTLTGDELREILQKLRNVPS